VPDKWRRFCLINPMVGVIDGFRWTILGGDVRMFWFGFIVTVVLVALLLVTGIWHFRKMAKTFADVI
jgi:lipopolysaccharide transport system permease protein